MSAHRVVLTFDDGVTAKLVCPDNGCTPANICGCGRDLNEPESEPCYDCGDAETWRDECWLKTWFDDLTADELLHGTIEFPVTATWDGDHPLVEIESPSDPTVRVSEVVEALRSPEADDAVFAAQQHPSYGNCLADDYTDEKYALADFIAERFGSPPATEEERDG